MSVIRSKSNELRARKWHFVPFAVLCAASVAVFALPQLKAQEAAAPAAQAAPAGAPAGQAGDPGQGAGRGRGRGRGLQPDLEHPVLPIGSPLPDFNLMGIDDKTHAASEYANAKVLAIVFESNHCPVSIAYEERIRKIYEDYQAKGVQLVAINPNNASAVRLNELGYTDSTDSMPEMKIRAKLRNIDWPYLYDGENQKVAAKFGAVATPHIFIFDQDRKLRYEGHIDDATDINKVKSQDARIAIDALLAGQSVPVASTRAFGCTTKWLEKSTDVKAEWDRIMAEPVNLTKASADDLKTIRENKTGKTVVVAFWSTKCKECEDEIAGYQQTFRMYRNRKFDLITVSTDAPKDSAKVLAFLQDPKQHASTKNYQFDQANIKALQAAFGEKWKANTPFVMVIAPDGSVAFQKAGAENILDVRRHVLATIPNDGQWFGVNEYWTSVIKAQGQGQ
jgi:peroxiredoxin